TLGLQLDQAAELGVLRRQLLGRASFVVRGNAVNRNSPPYARSARKWWTPLNEYDPRTPSHGPESRRRSCLALELPSSRRSRSTRCRSQPRLRNLNRSIFRERLRAGTQEA